MNGNCFKRSFKPLLGVVFFAGTVSACSTCKPVYVATAIPSPPLVSRPVLEISKIGKDSSDGDVVVAYRVTIEQLLQYSGSLEQIVKTYSDMSKNNNNKLEK